jgi:iron complex transport system substrate-binding protein
VGAEAVGAAAPRVASLLPSATEIVCALGAEQQLVGVSHECDWPPSVVGRPVLTSTRLPSPEGDARASAGIDRELRRLLRDALAVYAVDEDALAAARPDVIVTQNLCEVCAVSYDEVAAAARRLTNPDLRLVDLSPLRLDDIRGDIARVGAALGRAREAETLLADIDRRMDAVRVRAERAVARAGGVRPHVLTIEWIDPPMVGGTWMPELVALAGGQALVSRPGDHAPTLQPAQLAALDPAPDVVLVKPCGFPLARTTDEADALSELLAPLPWPAVRHGRLWIADGNAYFNRPGPRIVDSLEILAACVHPQAFGDFAARHAGSMRRFVPA